MNIIKSISKSISNYFAKVFASIGSISTVNPCFGFTDESEIPKELTDLYE
ncbi:cyclic lactone autoinducer peptide [Staphylococcus pseudoxylosus]|nr:cyclic lactone autoinducer peptide [Staphylococcus pseudoxylosus]MDW8798292.1 cyclic lactone autoinducer peptide [Staphylococcus pseudoxylosus]MEB6037817.1 cyclic lactone autoinducer peptide [Staphylococcus pseudoxylosus]MEB7765084.1 cyclic lactone autoinducer peptide [Staphylococcus pseudoxylosus]MEB8087974.1 cyclic lactone autoinducer peptide [Staphylococcus pseudoxylosus]